MKKIFSGVSAFILALTLFAPAVAFASPADINGLQNGFNGTQVTWASGNVGERITGTLTEEGRKDYNSWGESLDLRYIYNPSNETINLNSLSVKIGTSDVKETLCTVNPDKVKEGEKGYNDFICETLDENLDPGIYTFQIGGNGKITWTSFMKNGNFTIEGEKVPPASVKFNSATVSGNSVTVSLDFKNVPSLGGFTSLNTNNIELGSATQQGDSSRYSCAPLGDSASSEKIGIPEGDSTQTFTVSGLADNNYCVRFDSTTLSAYRQNIDGDGFFLDKGALFSVGTAKLVANATNNPNANGYGCVTTGDNRNYCLLAPLPGVGDSTGSLDVSGKFNTYLTTIIRLFFGIVGVLSVLMIVIGGIEYMSSTIAGEKEGAKNRIRDALLGLLLALSSYLILKTINPKLIDGGITIPQVEVAVDENTYEPTAGSGVNTPTGTVSVGINSADSHAYDAALKSATGGSGVECNFAKAIMAQESGFQATKNGSIIMSTYTDKNGNVGHAYGLMQLIPATFSANGGTGSVTDANNTTGNIIAGVNYIKSLMRTGCNGSMSNNVCTTSNLKYVAAAYNSGAGQNGPSKSCSGITKWECTVNTRLQQTRDYAATVMANYQYYKSNPGTGC